MNFLFHSLRVLLFAFFITQALQHDCIHDQIEQDIQVIDPANSLYSTLSEGRILGSQGYQNIKIMADLSTFNGVSDTLKNYVMNSLMPPVINYFGAALKVPERNGMLTVGNLKTLCSGTIQTPSVYNSVGVDADFVIFVTGQNDPSASYVASAAACLIDAVTNRPLIGKMTYNLARIDSTTNDALRENHILVTMHELTHALGFSNGLYNYYINPNTNKVLTGHVSKITSNGLSTTILNLAPLTTRLRNHFGCSTLKGAYIENQGGAGSVGSHFERRVLYNEYMTASAIIDTRVTEFSLALLEGTGWYQVNYDMAEPMTWGKNQGCSFVEGPCMDKATKRPLFEEFCPNLLEKSCSWTRRAGASCGAFTTQTQSTLPSAMDWWGNKLVTQDTFSDNCPTLLTYSNLDCEDSSYQGKSTLKAESYGYGSKCFTGTLYPGGKLSSSYPLCFKPNCVEVYPGQYYLEVQVGSVKAVCTSERSISVSGFGGVLNCPDPQEFCEQILTEGNCRRGCSGRGTCVNRVCQCPPGWTGYDCSKPTFDNRCSRCANLNEFKTSCFGDTCECNPSNTTCMCLLGLKSGSICENLPAIDSSPDSNSENTGAPELPGSTNTELPKLVVESSKGSKTLIPIAIGGAVGGVVVIGGIILLIKYKMSIRSTLGSRNNDRTKRPNKIKISKIPIEESANQSQNSPATLSNRNLSLRMNNGDSPLVSQSSPVKGQSYAPSRFKNCASKAIIQEQKDVVEMENQAREIPFKSPKVGNSVMLEHGQTIDLTRPESVIISSSQPIQSIDKNI